MSDSDIGKFHKGLDCPWAFDMQAMFPSSWQTSANELHRMVVVGYAEWCNDCDKLAIAIKEQEQSQGEKKYTLQPSTLHVSFFLAALAIENLLKGVLVYEHPEYIKSGKLVGKNITSHDLVKIADDAKFHIDETEAEFCKKGTEAIKSFGRYHIAKNMSETISSITIKDKEFMIYERLYDRLNEYITKNPVPKSTKST